MPFTGGCAHVKPQSSLEASMAEVLGDGGRRGIPWRIIGWGGAVVLLASPFIAMQMHADGVNWSHGDFIVMGMMLAIVGGLIEFAVRASSNWSYRGGAALAVLGGFLVTWANLAVGIVGSENNPANQFFFAALLIGIAGSIIARGRSRGMAWAMFATAIAIAIAFLVAEAGIRDEPMVRPLIEGAGTSIFVLMFAASALLFRRAARQLPA
jgi:hypothetical protein